MPLFRKVFPQKTVFYQSLKLYNLISANLKCSQNYAQYERNIKEHIVKNENVFLKAFELSYAF